MINEINLLGLNKLVARTLFKYLIFSNICNHNCNHTGIIQPMIISNSKIDMPNSCDPVPLTGMVRYSTFHNRYSNVEN